MMRNFGALNYAVGGQEKTWWGGSLPNPYFPWGYGGEEGKDAKFNLIPLRQWALINASGPASDARAQNSTGQGPSWQELTNLNG